MDAGSLDRLRADLGEEDGLWPEHEAVVAAFLICQTQWRVASVSEGFNTRIRYIGLDYPGCRIALDVAGVESTAELWTQLQILELAGAAMLNGSGTSR